MKLQAPIGNIRDLVRRTSGFRITRFGERKRISDAHNINFCLRRVVDLVLEVRNVIFFGVGSLHDDTH